MHALWLGLGLGILAALSPGPLMALVIAGTLRGGFRRGLAISLAPLFTDIPIILAALFLLLHLPPQAPRLLSLAGGALLVWMGIGTLRRRGGETPPTVRGSGLKEGVLLNMTNPHAYIFWVTVGTPLLVLSARQGGWLAPVLLAGGFFTMLVGLKILLAYGVSRAAAWTGFADHPAVRTAIGIGLIAMGILVAVEGLAGSL